MQNVAKSTADWANKNNFSVELSAQTGSTNDDAKQNVHADFVDFKLYVTEHQTAGRGRGKNNWADTNSDALLSTWSFAIDDAPQAITGPRVGLAVFRAVKTQWPDLGWSLKAPNDLLLNGLKIAGILVETVSMKQHRCVVGLGFNVLSHPVSLPGATHLGSAHAKINEGEWHQFLSLLQKELATALKESVRPELTESARHELEVALNSNPKRSYVVKSISPQGDIDTSSGLLKWTEM